MSFLNVQDRFYVCFSKADNDIVQDIMSLLCEELRIDYTLPSSFLVGNDSVETIVEKSEFVLFFLSRNTLEDRCVEWVYEFCNNLNKRMIPIKIEQCDTWIFRSRIYDFYSRSNCDELVQQIRSWLGLEKVVRKGTKSFNVGDVCFNMMPIQAGTFDMGATKEQLRDAQEDEKPVHNVKLGFYYLGEYLVTQSLWETVMGSNPSKFKGRNLPIVNVSWNDCKSFINQLNQLCVNQLGDFCFNFPMEAEWEYAARGGRSGKCSKYSGSDNADDVAWSAENSDGIIHSVGRKEPNELGLYDLSGNVYEWCLSWYRLFGSIGEKRVFRVCRGGAFDAKKNCCRVSARHKLLPDVSMNNVGLRLALKKGKERKESNLEGFDKVGGKKNWGCVLLLIVLAAIIVYVFFFL